MHANAMPRNKHGSQDMPPVQKGVYIRSLDRALAVVSSCCGKGKCKGLLFLGFSFHKP